MDLDAWTDDQLQSVLKWGNARANKSVSAGKESWIESNDTQVLGGETRSRPRALRSVGSCGLSERVDG